MKSKSQKSWFNNLIDLIDTFSDIGFQQEVWIMGKEFYKGEGPFLHWYDDAIGDYFDSFNMSEYEKMIEHGYITDEEFEIIRPFHEKLSEYQEGIEKRYLQENHHFDQKDLNSKEWNEVIETAKETLRKLKKNDRR